ncbi:hypothetical protein B0H14DRAFT_2633596 [Mycena olivaceomarginata]|nr:hypothetical protein B0H14DRAFT_2633596 [Mycena olivaceomarginata]
MDILTLTLVLCLLATNLNRLLVTSRWIWEYLCRPREPQLIPYFDEQGCLIGLVRVGPNFRHQNQPHLRSGWIISDQDAHTSSGPVHSTSPTLVPAVQNRTAHKSIPQSPFFWDFWRDGELKFLVSSQDLRDTNNLATNWVLETTRSNGSTRAPIWDKGHETRKQCVGIIRCHDSTCSMRLAPALRAVERHK